MAREHVLLGLRDSVCEAFTAGLTAAEIEVEVQRAIDEHAAQLDIEWEYRMAEAEGQL